MIEVTKTCAVAFTKAINSVVVEYREKHVNWGKKKPKDRENLFFKVLVKRFWLTSKSFS